jgi:peptide/nickel transport system permease protein
MMAEVSAETSTGELLVREAPARGLLRTSVLRLLYHPQGAFGLSVTALLVIVALGAPYLSPFDPVAIRAGQELRPPFGPYLLGTDQYGRDILSRIIWGTRVSLAVGLLAVSLGALVGMGTGLIGGYVGGRTEALLSRIWDTILAFPAILLGVAVTAALGPGVFNAGIAVAIINMPIFFRITRASLLVEKEKDYVAAARALGATDMHIVCRGIVPNTVSPIIVQVTVAMAQAVLLEAGLSFLGLGAQPPEPSWGSMLSESRQYLRQAGWYGVFPGVALMILLAGLNALSDALRDVLDPRQIAR